MNDYREEKQKGRCIVTTDRILLVTHVPIRNVGGEFSIDDQTSQGLIRWCENFEHVTYAGIAVPDSNLQNLSSSAWVPIGDLPCAGQLHVIAMPHAYKLKDFIAAYKHTRRMLANEIARSRYLCFTLGALTGDWAAVAGLQAIKQRRGYAVWFDRVEHEVMRSDLPSMPLKRRIKETLSIPLMRPYHHYLIRRSQLGLFQGKDCYDCYIRYSDKAFCVYDTHTKTADFIDAAELGVKYVSARSGEVLRICYVGRAADMKGPFDWLETLTKIRDAGVAFEATWIGDGPLIESMRKAVEDRNLVAQIDLPGFVSDRTDILTRLKKAHIFLFCHKTPESPRCLIESLVCGTPILGYGSAYARDLVATHGGGQFVNLGDIQGLVDQLIALARNRAGLAKMIKSAARSGLRFDEETVYRERADLIRGNL
jgi:glycosyltransferase involved in cell wall biosynthesis